MRIERINDKQLQFLLMQADLLERDIKISELSHSSDKTQRLFKEIIQIAQDEAAFVSESTQYLVEAKKIGVDCLVIMLTKIDADDMEKYYGLIPTRGKQSHEESENPSTQAIPECDEMFSVFSFEDLDVAATAADATGLIFCGDSHLYKLNGRYYLLLLNEADGEHSTADIEAILHEFGDKHVSSVLSKQYLCEYGDLIISEDAVGKLGLYLASN